MNGAGLTGGAIPVLDLFAGTGTTGEAAFLEGMNALLMEREADYQADIARRMALVLEPDRVRRAEAQAAKAARGQGLPVAALPLLDLSGGD